MSDRCEWAQDARENRNYDATITDTSNGKHANISCRVDACQNCPAKSRRRLVVLAYTYDGRELFLIYDHLFNNARACARDSPLKDRSDGITIAGKCRYLLIAGGRYLLISKRWRSVAFKRFFSFDAHSTRIFTNANIKVNLQIPLFYLRRHRSAKFTARSLMNTFRNVTRVI